MEGQMKQYKAAKNKVVVELELESNETKSGLLLAQGQIMSPYARVISVGEGQLKNDVFPNDRVAINNNFGTHFRDREDRRYIVIINQEDILAKIEKK